VLAKDFTSALLIGEKVGIADGFFEFPETVLAFGDELRVVH